MLATTLCCAALAAAPSGSEAYTFAVSLARDGERPAASAAERKAHQRVAARFRAVGLRVGYERFTVPGKGRSRNVIGIRDAPGDCLVIAMAHADTVPPSPGAHDNASGVGTLVALARSLATDPTPACDVWLVATGAEERPYTGTPDHLGASALVTRLRRIDRLKDVRLALSLDEVGRGSKFDLHSTASSPRANVERRLMKPGVRWVRDPRGEGNSDHRELARAGAPAAKLGVPSEPCRHTACDTPDRLERSAFTRVLRIVWPLLRTWR
ncbi:M28 family peptidase [Solirubrobacter sp. CPCC 204708]|uniref:M28 family metallopeptidase n=1 Tax=Solirubrobacter deserti TaxID=2282478 RepID=A0ABT4RPN5_9ACTN|nr:M28 family peptidase [Solirubrobacter deserti]MBE2316625.1 M28 family peptidase [Solirubrobacter deserti]MDA0140523.1 M28 family metallopeptidase [Solirubrobacter deserti]